MKVFCWVPNPHANGAGLNFKSDFRPAALVCFTKCENFKNFKECEEAVNLLLEARIANRAVNVRSLGFKARAKAADREAISARRAGSGCPGAKTAGTMPIDVVGASKNISNFAPLKHCADRKNFKIFASDEIKFATRSEPKPTTRSMAKFVACSLKFEPCGTAARDFAMRDKILNSNSRKNCVSFKISPPRGEKTK